VREEVGEEKKENGGVGRACGVPVSSEYRCVRVDRKVENHWSKVNSILRHIGYRAAGGAPRVRPFPELHPTLAAQR
jgi:hypothetical protein